MGLASWAGPGSAEGEAFERLVRAFDVLDGSDAFVHPDAMATVAASGKRAERAALDVVVEVIESAVHRTDSTGAADEALFCRIADGWSSEPAAIRPARHRAGRRTHPHRVDVQPDGGPRLGTGRPGRTPGGDGASRKRRQRSRTAMRTGEHANGAALHHVSCGARTCRTRHRRRDIPGPAGLNDRHAAVAEHLGDAGACALGPRSWQRHRLADVATLPSTHAADGVRAR